MGREQSRKGRSNQAFAKNRQSDTHINRLSTCQKDKTFSTSIYNLHKKKLSTQEAVKKNEGEKNPQHSP